VFQEILQMVPSNESDGLAHNEKSFIQSDLNEMYNLRDADLKKCQQNHSMLLMIFRFFL
jgi:hypothetical protein